MGYEEAYNYDNDKEYAESTLGSNHHSFFATELTMSIADAEGKKERRTSSAFEPS